MSGDDFQLPSPDPALRRLDFLAGEWHLSGTIGDGVAPSGGRVTGTQTVAWLTGGFFLVRRWETTLELGGTRVLDAGYEFFDYDPEAATYRTHFFTSVAPYHSTRSRCEGRFEGDALVMTGPGRITRMPVRHDAVRYEWDLPGPEGTWIPWMRAMLSRTGGGHGGGEPGRNAMQITKGA